MFSSDSYSPSINSIPYPGSLLSTMTRALKHVTMESKGVVALLRCRMARDTNFAVNFDSMMLIIRHIFTQFYLVSVVLR